MVIYKQLSKKLFSQAILSSLNTKNHQMIATKYFQLNKFILPTCAFEQLWALRKTPVRKCYVIGKAVLAQHQAGSCSECYNSKEQQKVLDQKPRLQSLSNNLTLNAVCAVKNDDICW